MAEYDLKTILPRVRATPWNFGLYRGEDGDQLLVTAAPPARADLQKIEPDCGKPRQILKGVVSLVEGKLVFAMKIAPAPAWEKMIATTLQHRKCGHYLPITLRQLGAEESEEVDATSDPDAARAKSEWETLKTELLPAIKAALGNSSLKARVTAGVAAASTAEKAESFEEASAAFRELQAFLQPAEATEAAPAPSAPVAAAPAPAVVPAPVKVVEEMAVPIPPIPVEPEPAPAAPAPAEAPPPAATPAPAASDDLDDLLAALEGN